MFNKETDSLIITTSSFRPFFRFTAERMPDVVSVVGKIGSGKTVASIGVFLDLIKTQSKKKKEGKLKALALMPEATSEVAVSSIEKQLPRHNIGVPIDIATWADSQKCELTLKTNLKLTETTAEKVAEEISQEEYDVVFVDQADLVFDKINEIAGIAPVVLVNSTTGNGFESAKQGTYTVVHIGVANNNGYLETTSDGGISTASIAFDKLFEGWQEAAPA